MNPNSTKSARGRDRVIPSQSDLERERESLPRYPPHDVKQLIGAAASPGASEDEVVAAALTRRKQIDQDRLLELLTNLGVDPKAPDAWHQGFSRLARLYHGVGAIQFRAKPASQNARKWSSDLRARLTQEMVQLTAKLGSQSKALDEIASKDEFPFHPKAGHGGGNRRKRAASPKELRRNALKTQWEQIKTTASLDRQLGAVCPTDPETSVLFHILLEESLGG